MLRGIERKMKAALLYGKHDMRIVEIPTPKVGPDEFLIKVKAAKVCPTDIRKYNLGAEDEKIGPGKLELPANLCHEYTGDIVEIGVNVKDYKKGMRVTGFGFSGNAEYSLITRALMDLDWFEGGILELPENVSYEEGTFVTPLSECIHAVIDQAECQFGDTIVIVGAGQMGLMQTWVAKASGATTIVTDVVESRLEMAREFGADYVINPLKADVEGLVKRVTHGNMANCAIATISAPDTIKQAINITGTHGRIVLFGGAPKGLTMTFDPNWIHYAERTLVGCEGIGLGKSHNPKRRVQALKILSEKKIPIGKLIPKTFPLEEITKVYEMIMKKEIQTAVIKIAD